MARKLKTAPASQPDRPVRVPMVMPSRLRARLDRASKHLALHGCDCNGVGPLLRSLAVECLDDYVARRLKAVGASRIEIGAALASLNVHDN